jgi:amino acid adenylation domain-containing protein
MQSNNLVPKPSVDIGVGASSFKFLPTDLSDNDRHLFELFGRGETAELPFHNICDAFEYQVSLHPHAIAARHGDESITYAQLNLKATRLAADLIRQGVAKGDNVGLFVQRSIPMLVGILAILKAEATYVPQDPRISPAQSLLHVMKTAQTKVILTLKELKPFVPVLDNHSYIEIDADADAAPQDIAAILPVLKSDGRSNQVCFVLFTSGTTGFPNGVQVTHRNLCNIILTSPGGLGIQAGMTVAQILNIAFDMAAWEIFGALSKGATLLIRGKDIGETASKANVIIATPSILASIDASTCANIKVVAVAGEPCPKPLADKWSSLATFYNSCGPTEVTIVNTMQKYDASSALLTIGKPNPNTTVYILNEDMKPCAIGEIGEMWAGGDCVSLGYIGNESLTAERYQPDPYLGEGRRMFRTRDLGRWTKDGELQHFGRTDDQVKVRGFRVELDAISAALESIAGISQAVTLKLDDRNLATFVTPKDANTELALLAIRSKLPYYCTPSFIHALDELPKTNRGKIDKRALTVKAAQIQMDSTVSQVDETRSSAEVRPIPSDGNLVSNDTKSCDALPDRSWIRSVLSHRFALPYYRLAVLVMMANIWLYFREAPGDLSLDFIRNAILGNFTLAILIRQQYVINLLFKIATSIPTTWPLGIRKWAAKVYHVGGLHVGAFASGTVWMCVYLASQIMAVDGSQTSYIGLTALHLLILVTMCAVALPVYRHKFHNSFEIIGRFGGWLSLLLFWSQSILLALQSEQNLARALLTTPQVWVLGLVTFSVALPWMRLKRIAVAMETPSNHVSLSKFDYGVTPFAGSSTDLSRNPLIEWHSFANIPTPGQSGFRLTISRAGDWTGSLIDEKPTHLWVKGIPTAGVGNIELLFKRVIWLATGSGIGPCLPHLFANNVPSKLIWSTRNPRKTYGDQLVDEILSVQPDALIWDTTQKGKPDLVALAYKAMKEFDAEAVICISNRAVTFHVNHELESRGLASFGAIWDS